MKPWRYSEHDGKCLVSFFLNPHLSIWFIDLCRGWEGGGGREKERHIDRLPPLSAPTGD